MSDMRGVKVGDLVFIKTVPNRWGSDGEKAAPKIDEMHVTRVGRKYFFVTKHPERKYAVEHKFNRDGGGEATGYTTDRWAFPSMQAIMDDAAHKARQQDLRKMMNYKGLKLGRLTMEQLDAAIAILAVAYE